MRQSTKVGSTIAAVLLLVIGAYVVFVVANGPDEADTVKDSKPRTEQPTAEQETTDPKAVATAATGTYKEYDKQAFESQQGRKVLFFHAPWCSQCRKIDSELNKTNDEGRLPDELAIYKIDYDSHQDLRAKYGVTLQTTFVAVDSQGELVKKYVAYDEPTYESIKENFFEKI